MKISRSFYTISLPNQTHQGALLKFEKDSWLGYADLRPWPSLGDEPLESQWAYLEKPVSQWSPLLQKSFHFAQKFADGSLFVSNEQIRTYCLASLQSEALLNESVIKLKVNAAHLGDWQLLTSWIHRHPKSRFRIDFNNSGCLQSFQEQLQKHLTSYLPQVDYIEDPFPYDGVMWERVQNECGVKLALDRWTHEQYPSQGYSYVILKPAYQDTHEIVKTLINPDVRVVVTHSLDHVLGQVGAFAEAQELMSLSSCAGEVYGLRPFVEENNKEPIFLEDHGLVCLSQNAESLLRRQMEEREWQILTPYK